MKQKEFPINPAAIHLGVLLLRENGANFEIPPKMDENQFADIYNKFCENFGDGYSSSYNGMYYDELRDEYYFPFNENYAIACINASLFYGRVKNVFFEFKGNFSKFVACYTNHEIILSELFPQSFDLDVKSSRLNPKKGRIFKTNHKFLSLELEAYLERVPIELSKKLVDATKFAFSLE